MSVCFALHDAAAAAAALRGRHRPPRMGSPAELQGRMASVGFHSETVDRVVCNVASGHGPTMPGSWPAAFNGVLGIGNGASGEGLHTKVGYIL